MIETMPELNLVHICHAACNLIPETGFSQENQKSILIGLTEVSKGIRILIKMIDADNMGSRLYLNHEIFYHSEDKKHNCLSEILSTMKVILAAPCPYTRHAAEKILLTLFELLHNAKTVWFDFTQLLIDALHMEVLSFNSLPSLPSLSRTASLVQVLSKVLKSAKQSSDMIEVDFVTALSRCFLNIPWSLLDIVYLRASSVQFDSVVEMKDAEEPRAILLGSILQLFCSLVACNYTLRGSVHSSTKLTCLRIRELLPQIFTWCFLEDRSYSSTFVSAYTKHKILALMIGLSNCDHHQNSTSILWLQLLKKYFQDILELPVSCSPSDLEKSLLDSPFRECMFKGTEGSVLPSRHIQRQAIFLLLKCCLTLVILKKETCKETSTSSLSNVEDAPSTRWGQDNQINCYSVGVSELFNWLQMQISAKKIRDHDSYLLACYTFSEKILHLFLGEDDLLFEILLLLSRELVDVHTIFCKFEEDPIFHIRNIFGSRVIFHLFLAGIHYDYSLLVDYLISRDTGVQCAQYLLRSLRALCESTYADVQCLPRKQSSIHSFTQENGNSGNSFVLDSCLDAPFSFFHIVSLNLGSDAFENARKCLSNLRICIEKLHEKNIFPYNPGALLKSLAKLDDFSEKVKC